MAAIVSPAMELIDSHCHIDFPELAGRLPEVIHKMAENNVLGALCVSVRLEDFPKIIDIAGAYPNIWATVGVHPDTTDSIEPTVDELVKLAGHPKVIAIGETGLDFFRQQGDVEWQKNRFRAHIRAARATGKPLVVHTRDAAQDTLAVLREEGAEKVGGIMHCFTETLDVAKAAMDLGFYVSFSGIVSFKKATQVQDVARAVPLDRMLVETDAPYLAPVPFRGKTNEPAFVRHVAEALADVREVPLETLADATTANFRRLFPGTL